MSGFSLSSSRPTGRALIVGSATSRAPMIDVIGRVGYQPTEADDPYAAMAELCRRPLAYRAVVLSLNNLYQEELQLITAIKRRYAHMEIWLAQTDGRPAALADALRLGADGLLADDGLHRFTATPKEAEVALENVEGSSASDAVGDAAGIRPAIAPPPGESHQEHSFLDNPSNGEPILTAEELRALLEDPPIRPVSAPED